MAASSRVLGSMARTALLWTMLLVLMAEGLNGHSPYGNFYRWRKDRLLIVTCASDSLCYPLGAEMASAFGKVYPASHPAAVRAPNTLEALKLLLSHQFSVALVPSGDLDRAAEGAAEFEELRPWLTGVQLMDAHSHKEQEGADHEHGGTPPLRWICQFGSHVLLANEHVSERRAYLIARSLVAIASDAIPSKGRPGTTPLPIHQGAEQFYQGRDLPPLQQGEWEWLQ